MKPYGEMSTEERAAAWALAEAEGGPLAAPPGFHAYIEAQQPAPPYRPTPKRLRKALRMVDNGR